MRRDCECTRDTLHFGAMALVVGLGIGLILGVVLTAPRLERCEQALDECGDHYDECVLEGEVR